MLSQPPYRRFSDYLRQRFGGPVRKLTVDAGFSCPNRDGRLSTGGCVFCHIQSFSGRAGQPSLPVAEQLRAGISQGRARGLSRFMAYFQPSTNTYAPLERLRSVYNVIRDFPEIKAVAIGTRPDCVDEKILELIADYCPDYEVWIEYGLQTIHEPSLRWLQRGHTAADFYRAVELARKHPGIKICAHVILGLPLESEAREQETAETLARLRVEGVKLHPLYVVKSTALADIYAAGNFRPLSEEDYVRRVVGFLERLRPDTVIQRLTADCPAEWLLAPDWLRNKAEVIRAVEDMLQSQKTRQGRLAGRA